MLARAAAGVKRCAFYTVCRAAAGTGSHPLRNGVGVNDVVVNTTLRNGVGVNDVVVNTTLRLQRSWHCLLRRGEGAITKYV
ncbi:MAG: hypothetical protein LUB59_01225 [Candidatus Gastranaerophilales bacterium]|nr:hypothetical protein [Candidatus Gastranaerophilales bacterium]